MAGVVWFGLFCSEVVSMEYRLFAQLFICVFAHLRIRVVAALALGHQLLFQRLSLINLISLYAGLLSLSSNTRCVSLFKI